MLLTFPALLVLVTTVAYPIGSTLLLSFETFKMSGPARFVGFANYAKVLASSDFLAALGHTLLFVAATAVVEAAIALPLALALNRGLRGSRLFTAVVTMPLMVAPVVAALAWRFLFSDRYGFINGFLDWTGFGAISWFGSVWLSRATILIANLWLATPFDTLMLLAGLASLPQEPLEAARMDGASRLQVLRYIALPMLRPVILVILVVRLADAFKIFDTVYVLTGGGPANTTEVMSSYIYKLMFTKLDFAAAAAASMILVAVTAAVSIVAVTALRRDAAGAIS